MKKLHIIMIFIMLLMELPSCVKDINMDTKERPQLAVACILSDDPVQELHIVYTKGASLKETPKVMEAEAILKDITRGEIFEFARDNDGVWRLHYAAQPRHKYRLEVTVPGYETLWAEDLMPDKIKSYLQHVYWLMDMVESPTGYLGNPTVIPEEPFDNVGERGVWLDGDDIPRGETFWCVTALEDPVWIYAMNYNQATGQREIADAICTDYKDADGFNVTGNTYVPIQWEEPIPYPIKPQFTGLLAGTHIKALYPFMERSPMHRKYIRIPPKDIVNKDPIVFGVSGSFKGAYNHPDSFVDAYFDKHWGYVRELAEDEGYVVWTAVSEALDNYLKDACKMNEMNISTDLTTIYLRDNFYANIQGSDGSPKLGVFGCKIERKFQWSSEGTYIDYDRSNEPSSFKDCLIILPKRGPSHREN